MIIRTFVISATLLISQSLLHAQQIEKPGTGSYKTTFAIVVDDSTYQEAKDELYQYKKSIEQKGLGAYLIHQHWNSPEEIRKILHQLYQEKPRLEGAVLIGHIPVPMIRDAQHLTSTFKMDQRIDWKRSSVPSDRFYDDFDLQFNFIKQDSLEKSYYYYQLSAASPQHITMDIYTARVKPTAGVSFYADIRRYLQKAITAAPKPEKLDHLMVYTGHGYHSESLNAWAGEQLALREQLPHLFRPGGKVDFLNFRMETFMRFPYLNAIQDPELDLAIYHGHGSDDSQLLNGYPLASAPHPSIENIKRYLRSKIQGVQEQKGDVEAAKKRYHDWLDVPLSWMADALVDSVMQADSIFNAQTDLSIIDLQKIKPNARMIMLDACDNGAFHLPDYLAAHYPFQAGQTLLSVANSVGVLQDLWPDELLGVLAQGVRVGNWFKEVAYLETHLFGDPTFAFSEAGQQDLNTWIVYGEDHQQDWKQLLQSPEADLQALALVQCFRQGGKQTSALLKQTYFNSPYSVVRMEAFKQLNHLDNADYEAVLQQAVSDPYELIRRLAVQQVGEKGDQSLIPTLVSSAINDRHSERVSSRVSNVLAFMESDAVIAEVKKQIQADTYLTDAASLEKELVGKQEQAKKKIVQDYQQLLDTSRPIKTRSFAIRTLRAYRYHEAVPFVIQLIQDEKQPEDLRVQALEALGWFSQSYQNASIQSLCNSLLNHPSQKLKEQAAKTLAILQDASSY